MPYFRGGADPKLLERIPKISSTTALMDRKC